MMADSGGPSTLRALTKIRLRERPDVGSAPTGDVLEAGETFQALLAECAGGRSGTAAAAAAIEPKPISEHESSPPCGDDADDALPRHPTDWPQRPIAIRPTPGSGTKVLGIRRAATQKREEFDGFGPSCILPVNTGAESKGESIVIDFESPHFVGTLMVRIRDTPRTDLSTYQEGSYFDGKKRTFQALVRGRFKTSLKTSECVTGQVFNRPAGKLPARWVGTSFIKFITTLAPQLEANVDGNEPRFLTPLVATAHTVLARDSPMKNDEGEGDGGDNSGSNSNFPLDLEEPVEEPAATDPSSMVNEMILGDLGMSAYASSSVSGRMKARKTVYNEIAYKKPDNAPVFSTEKEYTFEFYQHLLDFKEELAIDMGYPIGKVGLAQATDGQPIKIMSAHRNPETNDLDTLWSFDVWHESLYPFAELAVSEETK